MEKWEQIAEKFFSNEFKEFKSTIGSGRKPSGVQFTDINTDILRRDLTINALFYDTDTHEVVDLVGGIDDLKNGVVRTVGAAEDRFGEDRLRILRAIRFAGRFGSELDSATDAALKKDSSLEGISAERIKDEFVKGITSAKSVRHFLGLIAKYDLFKWVFAGLGVTDNFVEDKDPIIVIASLLKNNDPKVLPKILVLNLKYKDDEMRPIKFLIDLQHLSVENAVLLKRAEKTAKVTPEQIQKFASFNKLDTHMLEAFLKFRLSVTGAMVKDKFNLPDGPELGNMILKLETENFKKLL